MSDSSRATRRRWYAENLEKSREQNRRIKAKPENKLVASRRRQMITDRAKKVRAKLESVEYCDMAEILFGGLS